MNPYNLDPRNMTAEERERAAYLAGDYATVELIEQMQVEIESLRAAADMIDE